MTGVGAMDYSYNSKLRKASICLFYWVCYPGKVLIELCVGLEANFGQHPVKKRRSQKILFIFFGKKSASESLARGNLFLKCQASWNSNLNLMDLLIKKLSHNNNSSMNFHMMNNNCNTDMQTLTLI